MKSFGPLIAGLLISMVAWPTGAMAQAQPPSRPPQTPEQHACSEKCKNEASACFTSVDVRYPNSAFAPLGSPAFAARDLCVRAYGTCADACPK